jgi:hypothetical protein
MKTGDMEALERIVKECDEYLTSVEKDTERSFNLSPYDIALVSELADNRIKELKFLRAH